ncbi:MAG: response regulator [Alphaproteobacteria bacterium]|nr:response regulator [Alphaproteobacteria bacterium]MCD8563263.1 response regulator [Alphaproteobacteria bacterium]
MAHILLAEDDTSMREFLGLALDKAGHSVTSCEDGLSALEKLRGGENFDLLLTDIVMPGMDGIELAQAATREHPGLKVMFITGFAAVAMGEQQKATSDTKILSKPFHLKELVTQIDSLLKAA